MSSPKKKKSSTGVREQTTVKTPSPGTVEKTPTPGAATADEPERPLRHERWSRRQRGGVTRSMTSETTAVLVEEIPAEAAMEDDTRVVVVEREAVADMTRAVRRKSLSPVKSAVSNLSPGKCVFRAWDPMSQRHSRESGHFY